MKVRDGMTTVVLTVGPSHTLREASRMMSARRGSRPGTFARSSAVLGWINRSTASKISYALPS